MKTGDGDFKMRFAVFEDLEDIVKLHMKTFTVRDHLGVLFGKEFIRAAYSWFISSPEAYVLVAEKDGQLAGVSAIADKPYYGSMLRACKWQIVLEILKKPWRIFHPELFRRIDEFLFINKKKETNEEYQNLAQIAFTMVDFSFRRQGVGEMIKEEMKRITRERGHKRLMTALRRDNKASQHLNKKVGFIEKPEWGTKYFIHMVINLDD